MSLPVTRASVRAYAKRWELVETAELSELRATTPQQKFEQLARLMASARALNWSTTDAAEVDAVRSRWLLLARLHGD